MHTIRCRNCGLSRTEGDAQFELRGPRPSPQCEGCGRDVPMADVLRRPDAPNEWQAEHPQLTWAMVAEHIARMTPKERAMPAQARTIAFETVFDAHWVDGELKFYDSELDPEMREYGNHTN
jgi:hypothetical protein